MEEWKFQTVKCNISARRPLTFKKNNGKFLNRNCCLYDKTISVITKVLKGQTKHPRDVSEALM